VGGLLVAVFGKLLSEQVGVGALPCDEWARGLEWSRGSANEECLP